MKSSFSLRIFFFIICVIVFIKPSNACGEYNVTGEIIFENALGNFIKSYSSGDTLFIKIEDGDQNDTCDIADQFHIFISSETESLGETLTLIETGISTGVFTASIVLNEGTTVSSNDTLEVHRGDKITATYDDPLDDYGNPVTVEGLVYYGITFLSGTLVNDLTLNESPYLLTGDVTIPSGVNVDVEAGVELYFTPHDDDRNGGEDRNLVEIIVNGGFNINGEEGDSIRFNSFAKTPAVSDWYGIRYVGSSASHIRYGVFEHAYQILKYSGLNFPDSINISNNRIEDCTLGINIANCHNFTFNIFRNIFKNGYYFLSNRYDISTNINILIESNFIETYSGSGSQTIYIANAKDVILRNNIGIVKNDFLELSHNSGYTELSGNTVTGAEKFAFMTGRDFLVADNNFTGFYGISVQNSEQVEIFNNNLRLFNKGSDTSSINSNNYNGYGMFLGNNTHCNVRGNEIIGYGYDREGIYLGNVDSASFTDNIVKGFESGIMLNSTTGSICTLQNNTIFLNYNKGIYIKNNVSLTANYNNIYSNYDTLTYAPGSSKYYQSYDFYVESEIYNEIDARYNFWGDYLTQEIESGSNPKNITRIWDKYDNNALSFVNYGQWLACDTCEVDVVYQKGIISYIDRFEADVVSYKTGDTLRIKLADSDQNRNPSQTDTVSLTITCPSEPSGETLILVETGDSTGIFISSIVLSEGTAISSNDTLEVTRGDKITATYYDPLDDFGNPIKVEEQVYYSITFLSGTLVNDLTLNKSPYLLTGDVTIPSGVNVDVEAGVELYFTPHDDDQNGGEDPDLVEIIVNGGFNVNGEKGDSIRFNSFAKTPAVSDWYGIRYVGSSASHIKYGVFEHAYQLLKYSGLNFSDSINISNNRIEDCTFGINIANCQNFTFNIFGNIFKNGYYFLSNRYDISSNFNILIESNFIETYSGSGSQTIYIANAKDVILRNNIGIVKNDFLELSHNSGYTELSGNTVTGAEKFAFMTGRDFLVADNNYTGFSGISVQNSEQVEIFNNNLRLFYRGSDTSSINSNNYNGNGMFLGNNTYCNVRGNEIIGYGYDMEGIYLGYVDSASFTDNVVKGFKTGIMLNSTTGSICTLQNNSIFLNHDKGVYIKNNVNVTANYNNIYSNYDTLTYAPGSSTYYQTYDFYVESGVYNEIDARFNFWGDYLTQEIESGSNPKNITRIWDKYDDNALSFVNYGQWLSNVTIKNNYNISDTTLISGESYCFNATDQIIVAGDGNSVIIENGANANFVAGESVRFLPGFHAVAGSFTNAFITTTGIFCEPQYSGIELVSPDFKSLELEENVESFKGIENEKSVKIYPNPNNGHFTLELNNFDKPVDLYIMNMQGKVIYFSKEIEQSISSFDLSLHQNGIYFIRITKGIETYVRKIIKL